MLMIWFERKVISDMQSRIGPNRAGPYGLLQTLADGIKLFFKEDLRPRPGRPLRLQAGAVPGAPPGPPDLHRRAGRRRCSPSPATTSSSRWPTRRSGSCFVLAMSSISVYGVMLAGWSSGSKYPLLGSVRASAQMISYEAALGLTVVAVVLDRPGRCRPGRSWPARPTASGTGTSSGSAFVPFFLFLIAITAELNRPPFDLVEADSELVGGFNTEYSSIRFALFYLAEFMNTITMSAIVVTLFFGGPDGPIPRFIPTSDIWMPIVWFAAKTLVFLFIYVWFRAALPRLRYDQLMDLGLEGAHPAVARAGC